MNGITSRLPPIGNGIYVSTVSTSRSPPERSWSKFKKVLIDNPRDTNLLQRQKLWNFQKLNRGAFRSQVTSLPDIPYRVHKPAQKRSTVGTQADFYDSRTGSPADLRLILPRILQKHLQDSNKEEVKFTAADFGISRVRDEACSPIKFDSPTSPASPDKGRGDTNNQGAALPPDVTFVDDPGFEYDSVVRKIDVSTMTDAVPPVPPRINQRRKPPVPKRKNIMKDSTSFSRKKNVKFADDDIDEEENRDAIVEEIVRDVIAEEPRHNLLTLTSRPSTASSNASGRSSSVMFSLDNMGHSSQRSLDPLSVLDLLTGSRIADARYLSTDHKNIKNSQQVFKEKTKKKKELSNSEADRIWFEKIVGDKDVVDIDTYENFARVRPNNESQSDTDRQDASKTSLRKNFTPRINGESPVGKTPRGGQKGYPIFNKDEPPRRNGGTPTRTSRNSRGRNSK